ncbi:hypothetical protein TTHERM_000760291 (macronuclear) [Tetrahymena thermophila SB210]|uniref:Uncharacterized protein n=1 Tax=Tetrahymena thermophila (strain SB210) TaxID=312017 RepID=W7X5V5_TETTS|nr:hypothetical protein TTHERM_000760291 [Tetrahymena thermophila SB210]EWS71738.1 hypothetical protein TTHERM_000760291 [Tetrahymena thermophila SB210]|eukprot:XP_012655724.1 hypothetical protein TTHERM_000760291 [Tetrahymena thermophila SB210]
MQLNLSDILLNLFIYFYPIKYINDRYSLLHLFVQFMFVINIKFCRQQILFKIIFLRLELHKNYSLQKFNINSFNAVIFKIRKNIQSIYKTNYLLNYESIKSDSDKSQLILNNKSMKFYSNKCQLNFNYKQIKFHQ